MEQGENAQFVGHANFLYRRIVIIIFIMTKAATHQALDKSAYNKLLLRKYKW